MERKKLELGRRNARRVHLKIGVALKNSMPNSAAAVTTAAMATPDESAETLVRPERRSSYFHSATCSMWLAGLASELIKKTRADETSNWEGRRGRMGERAREAGLGYGYGRER